MRSPIRPGGVALLFAFAAALTVTDRSAAANLDSGPVRRAGRRRHRHRRAADAGRACCAAGVRAAAARDRRSGGDIGDRRLPLLRHDAQGQASKVCKGHIRRGATWTSRAHVALRRLGRLDVRVPRALERRRGARLQRHDGRPGPPAELLQHVLEQSRPRPGHRHHGRHRRQRLQLGARPGDHSLAARAGRSRQPERREPVASGSSRSSSRIAAGTATVTAACSRSVRHASSAASALRSRSRRPHPPGSDGVRVVVGRDAEDRTEGQLAPVVEPRQRRVEGPFLHQPHRRITKIARRGSGAGTT